jgi:circadian clock protein KaiC
VSRHSRCCGYQQQFTLFDTAKAGTSVHYVNLSNATLGQGLEAMLETIQREVEQVSPGVVVVVDSFRTITRAADGRMDLQSFLERLAIQLTSWQATTFLVGEYTDGDGSENASFTVADGVLWLYQHIDTNSGVRKLQAMQMRGQAPLPGLHTMRITRAGLHVFPRIIRRTVEVGKRP